MDIYIVQSYDSLCCSFNPYVVAFEKESDARKQVYFYNHQRSTILYSYVKIWLSKEVDSQ